MISGSIDAENDPVLRAVTSYLILVTMFSTKPPVIQVLLHELLYSASEAAHAAVDQLSQSKAIRPGDATMDTQHRRNNVLGVANGADIRDEEVQPEALALIASQEKHSGPSTDPVLVAIKEKLLAVTTTTVKSQTSRVPDWYVSELDLEFIRPVSDKQFETVHLPTGRLVEVQRLVGITITEYCALGSLDAFLHANERARAHYALSLLLQAANGVSATHSAGVVHGDLRCTNIGVTAEQQAKVKGLSHCIDGNAHRLRQYTGGDNNLSAEPVPVAVQQIRWLAPECVAGGAILSLASDVYAFGMMVYEAMTGRVPYDDLTEEAVLAMKQRGDASLPERGMEQIDREVRSLIQDACHANPIFRPSIQIVMMSTRSLARASAVTAPFAQPTSMTRMQPSVVSPTATYPVVTGYHPTTAAQSASTVAPVTTGTGKGSVTVYPVAMPPGFHGYQSQETTGAWQQHQQEGQTRVFPMVQPTPQAWMTPIAYRPPLSTTTEPPPPNSKKARWIVFIVVSIVAIVVPFTVTRSILSSSAGSDSSDDLSPSPTPSGGSAGTPTPTPTARMGTTSTYQDTFTSNTINAIAVDSSGIVYVAAASQIYRFAQSSSRENWPAAFAGTVDSGYLDGNRLTAKFQFIFGLAVDSADNLFIADSDNYRIRMISSGSTYVATGVGTGGKYTNDGAESQAAFANPRYLGVDQNDNIYISDGWYVHKWDRSAHTVSMVGNLGSFSALAVSPSGVIYMAKDSYVTCYDPAKGYINTVAGTNTAGYRDVQGTGAAFGTIGGIAFSPTAQDLYISDTVNHCIRRFNVATQQVTTFAGLCGTSGNQDGDETKARFNGPTSIAVSKSGTVYVADNGHTVRRIV